MPEPAYSAADFATDEMRRHLAGLYRAGRYQEAVALADGTPGALESSHGDVLQLIALCFSAAGRPESEALFRRLIAEEPDNPVHRMNLGVLMLNLDRPAEALPLLEEATRQDPSDLNALFNRGLAEFALGLFPRAAQSLGDVLGRDADNATARIYRARALHEMGRLDEANGLVRNWRPPGQLTLMELYELGQVLTATDNRDGAEQVYEAILQAKPDEWGARINLAASYERGNRLDEAERLLDGAPTQSRELAFYRLTQGKLLGRKGQHEAALAELDAAAVLAERELKGGARLERFISEVEFERGRLLDALGRYADAFAAISRANVLSRDNFRRYNPPQEAGARLDWMRDTPHLDAVVARARAVPPAGGSPVFLVGFPRSGTTLLDRILDAHPALQVMEEKPVMEAVGETIHGLPGGYPEALGRITEEQMGQLRRLYWAGVARYLRKRPGATLVDKYPLNLGRVHLIMTLFPDARWVFAIRHPLDVVLSCFMQNFRFTDATRGFWSIAETATIYEQVMSLWLAQKARLQPRCFDIRYEDLVADVEGTARRLVEFLGLPWDSALLAFHERARTQRINNPSYRQVVEPVYTSARGRWLNYRQWLDPAAAQLAPLARQLGYPDPTVHPHG